MKITGTIINYYFHCKRQCWLFANRINMEDNSEEVRMGRVLHDLKLENKENTEISLENIKIDKLTKDFLVEIKKSDADINAVKWQVLFYLKYLKNKGINKKGKIEFIERNRQSNKIHFVELDEECEAVLSVLSDEIESLVNLEFPPIIEYNKKESKKCKKCAYHDYCYI